MGITIKASWMDILIYDITDHDFLGIHEPVQSKRIISWTICTVISYMSSVDGSFFAAAKLMKNVTNSET